MPALREARKQLSSAQREVQRQLRAVAGAELNLALARAGRPSAGPAGKARSALSEARALLKAAGAVEAAAMRELADVIAAEAVRAGAEATERGLAMFKVKQDQKSEADLQKAVARFSAVWKKRRARLDADRLARRTRKLLRQEAQAARKANAKARAAVKKAVALAKARAGKAAGRLRAKAARLNIRL